MWVIFVRAPLPAWHFNCRGKKGDSERVKRSNLVFKVNRDILGDAFFQKRSLRFDKSRLISQSVPVLLANMGKKDGETGEAALLFPSRRENIRHTFPPFPKILFRHGDPRNRGGGGGRCHIFKKENFLIQPPFPAAYIWGKWGEGEDGHFWPFFPLFWPSCGKFWGQVIRHPHLPLPGFFL